MNNEDEKGPSENYLGPEKLENIRKSTITVVGAGAIGNEVVKNLGLLGVKKINLIDFDDVDSTNLNRCILFKSGDVGKNKAEVIKKNVKELGIKSEIIPYKYSLGIYLALSNMEWLQKINETWGWDLTEEKIKLIMEDLLTTDLFLACVDNDAARYTANRMVIDAFITSQGKIQIPLITGGMAINVCDIETYFPPFTSCFCCLMNNTYYEKIRKEEKIKTCTKFYTQTIQHAPAISILTSVIGSIMSIEAIKILIGLPMWREKRIWPEDDYSPLLGKIIQYESKEQKLTVRNVLKNPKCPLIEHSGELDFCFNCKHELQCEKCPEWSGEIDW